jgi:adenylate kinase
VKLIITGPPGAGKGTHAAHIAERYTIPAISTGALFRRHIAEHTPLGVQVQQIIEAGDLVPDAITDAIVAERLAEPDATNGWLLDGYPRDPHQVEALDALLGEQGVDAVVALVADDEVLVQRLLKRAAIEGRSDDNEETIRHRMSVYASETAPVLAVYSQRGKVIEVDATGGVDDVCDRIIAALDSSS